MTVVVGVLVCELVALVVGVVCMHAENVPSMKDSSSELMAAVTASQSSSSTDTISPMCKKRSHDSSRVYSTKEYDRSSMATPVPVLSASSSIPPTSMQVSFGESAGSPS